MSSNDAIPSAAADADDEPLAAPEIREREDSSSRKIVYWFAAALVLLGVVGRFVLYFENAPLWFDEAVLSAVIYRASWAEILQWQLPFWQSPVPLGFLALTKAVGAGFGIDEFYLRLLPFLAALLIFPLIYQLSRREFSPLFFFGFLFFWVGAYAPLYYAAEFKQYGVEALFTVIYLYAYAVYRERLENGEIPWAVAALIMAGILFSIPGAFVLAGILGATLIFVGANNHSPLSAVRNVLKFFVANTLIFTKTNNHSPMSAVRNVLKFFVANWLKFALIIGWAALYYWVYLRTGATSALGNDEMTAYFLTGTENPGRVFGAILIKIGHSLAPLTTNELLNALIFAVLFIGGMAALWREKRRWFCVVAIALGAHFIAYVLELYPLALFWQSRFDCHIGQRFSLYAYPLYFIPAAFLLAKILAYFRRPITLAVILAALTIFAVSHARWQKISAQHLDIQVIDYLNRNGDQPENFIAVSPHTVPVIEYYRRLYAKPYPYYILQYRDGDDLSYVPIFEVRANRSYFRPLNPVEELNRTIVAARTENRRRIFIVSMFNGYHNLLVKTLFNNGANPYLPEELQNSPQVFYFDLPSASTEGAQ